MPDLAAGSRLVLVLALVSSPSACRIVVVFVVVVVG